MDPGTDVSAIAPVFAHPASETLIAALGGPPSPTAPEVKSYSDAIFHNYHTLGFSISFTPPKTGSTPPNLTQIDIFNPPFGPSSRRKESWTGYSSPRLPITFRFPSTTITVPGPEGKSSTVTRPEVLRVERESTGRDFVECLGEPSRKGGGTGFMPPWLEWASVELKCIHGDGAVRIGVLIELRDPGSGERMTEEQQKMGAGGLWDRAARWPWGTLKLFDPNDKR